MGKSALTGTKLFVQQFNHVARVCLKDFSSCWKHVLYCAGLCKRAPTPRTQLWIIRNYLYGFFLCKVSYCDFYGCNHRNRQVGLLVLNYLLSKAGLRHNSEIKIKQAPMHQGRVFTAAARVRIRSAALCFLSPTISLSNTFLSIACTIK